MKGKLKFQKETSKKGEKNGKKIPGTRIPHHPNGERGKTGKRGAKTN